ncbi:DNA transformation protein [Lutibacter oricola]|uniref:DNA transformation protein n=1 Tax=Lutibacter oricola TaxID=762486 RepID=A0A1H2QKK8_9FLAO|nr:TfoX/Sxy family protein [Lutibacter oricola]SDW07712.1 DNA transformation protein [Lutibacter oricola]
MAVSNDFLQFVLDQLSGWGTVNIKKMFGGVALYQEELAFAMLMNDEVYLKVDDFTEKKFIKAGSVQLKLFKNNAVVVSFYSLPSEVLEDADLFKDWSKEAFEIQKKRNL